MPTLPPLPLPGYFLIHIIHFYTTITIRSIIPQLYHTHKTHPDIYYIHTSMAIYIRIRTQ